MSHDQRPGKLRVVADRSAVQATRRRGDAPIIEGEAELVSAVAAAGDVALAAEPSAKARLPLVQISVFLLACVIGGIAVALVRPFGLS